MFSEKSASITYRGDRKDGTKKKRYRYEVPLDEKGEKKPFVHYPKEMDNSKWPTGG